MNDYSVMHAFESWLEQYLNFEKSPKKDALWLDTMRFLCSEFKNPQNSYKSIHTAGSKGKGSVSVLCASVLEEAGFNTGLYTSPHVSDIRERIGRASGFFSEDEYSKCVHNFMHEMDFLTAKKLQNKKQPTWFELITLFSFICFEKCGMDWAVFETGLGGRLDSTNVLLPEVCALTLIEREHTEYLGDTLELIASEKAGIIKQGVPVCAARQKPEVKAVFKKTAEKLNAPVFFLDELLEELDYHAVLPEEKSFAGESEPADESKRAQGLPGTVQNVRLVFKKISLSGKSSPLFSRPLLFGLKLAGDFQAENAALAALTLKTVLPDLDESLIERGFAKAFLPARFEIIHTATEGKAFTLVVDGCHTPNSVAGSLKSFYARFGKGAHLLFACAEDKDVQTLAHIIHTSPCAFSRITLTVPGSVKASDYEKTRKEFETLFADELLYGSPDYRREIGGAFEAASRENRVLLAAGSFYLAAEVKTLLHM